VSQDHPRLILGIAGKVASGKDTVAEILRLQYGFRTVNLSDLVYEQNRQLQIKPTRAEQRNLATKRRKDDKAYWVKFADERAREDPLARGIALVSLYCVDEVIYLRDVLNGRLLAVQCDDIETRYNRYCLRYQSDPPRLLQEEEFEELDRKERASDDPLEPNIDAVLSMADLIVDNSSSTSHLSTQLRDLLLPFGHRPQNDLIPTNEENSDNPDTLFFVKRLEHRRLAIQQFKAFLRLEHQPELTERERALAALLSPQHSVSHVSDEFAVRLLDQILGAEDSAEAFSRYKAFPYHTTEEELALLLNETQFADFYRWLKIHLDERKKDIHRSSITYLREIVEVDKQQFDVEEGRSLEVMLKTGLSIALPPNEEALGIWNRALDMCGDGPTPVTEVLKNERIVEISNLTNSKISHVVHDAIDHLWFINVLNQYNLFTKYERLFDGIGNPIYTNIYKRESEAIASISFGVRSWSNFQVGYVPQFSIDRIAQKFDEHLENRLLEDLHSEAHRIIRRLAQDPLCREAQSLGFVFSNYCTELDEQRRRYGSIKFRNKKTNRVEGELDPWGADYLSFFIEAHHLLVGAGEKRPDGKPRVKHRDTLLRMHLMLESQLADRARARKGEGIRLTFHPENLNEFDFSSINLSPERIRWISHNFGFTAVRESVV